MASLLAEDRVELPQDVGRTLARLERERARQLAHVVHPQPEHRVDVHAPDRLRARPRELLDVDAALGRHHREVVAGRTVQHERRVELLRDRQQLLDQDAIHGHVA